MPPEIILIIAGVLALIGGGIYLGYRYEKKRTEAMRQACQAMGFAFEEKGPPDLPAQFGEIPLFDRGHSRKARNVMTGRVADRDVVLMEYQYTTGGGKNSHTWHQTVAIFPGGGRGLPDFELAPENIFHKIGGVFGYQDIDFEASEEFSKHYLLRGEDEMAIRSLFGAEALGFFAQNLGWSVQARGGRLAIFRASKRCKPEESPAFLAEALNVQRALAHS